MLPPERTITELILRWDELRRQGRELSAEELCRDCPEHTEELRQRIEAARAVDRLLDEVTADSGLPPGRKLLEELPQIDDYEILGKLGQGGGGIVSAARDRTLKRTVAVKMLLAGKYAMEDELARFRREAEALAEMNHVNVVQIHGLGMTEGRPYLVLEMVEGGSLAGRLANGPLTPQEAARVVAAAARAVEAAHAAGVIHRDLKPANVLMTLDGTP
jgi:serine/threonine-protein kinase